MLFMKYLINVIYFFLFLEQIVMTPTKRSQNHTTVMMERLKVSELDQNNVIHCGGGDHKGIVISKEPKGGIEIIFLDMKIIVNLLSFFICLLILFTFLFKKKKKNFLFL